MRMCLPALTLALLVVVLLPAEAAAQEEHFVFPAEGDDWLGRVGRRMIDAGDGVRGERALDVEQCQALAPLLVVRPNLLQTPDILEGCSAELSLTVDGVERCLRRVRPIEEEYSLEVRSAQPIPASPIPGASTRTTCGST